ncbi:hypothetical protein HRR83_005702 [Exophiala dermatitidis]|uniref:Major facilitator superfamily (MFS) profile domain-containing protein n=1 Tax=Exophiala dermatitidis TaxID=5970 RepID=A0AAN6IR90_EXODE|nr:hypothetical protein HRR73_007277 [Exophiala dermatitidis]KAJ4513258.1 hypothetical protein HRR74_006070 [Exophiala dermatitidis]KAJ4538194.1 hypothetical protein HRR77_007231 [Exophiala dermatitidis]KAJ4539931.1 hypothetical protein HRR76_003357 [Exophiala dermatitidis]KAJ4567915.1 hypothetical protein HRR81_006827 [Exophiala dermatitidis]
MTESSTAPHRPVKTSKDAPPAARAEGHEESKEPPTTQDAAEDIPPTWSVDAYGQTYPDGGRRAWWTLFGCFCTFFASLALMNSLGSYQAWLASHQLSHESPDRIGWIFGFYNFIAFFAGVQFGPWFDVYGPRPLSLVGSVALLASYCLMGLCVKFWHFFLCIGILGGLATSLLFTSAICTVQHWFYARRGLATGMAVSGGSLGGILFPLILEALFPQIGFAWTTRAKALMLLPFVAAGCLLMEARFSAAVTRRIVFPDLNVLLNRRVGLMTAAIFFMEWGLFVPLGYISSYALKEGIESRLAYNMLTFLNVGSLLGRWVPGYLGDKVGRFNTQIMAVSLCIISILAMWLLAGHRTGFLIATAVLFGFGSGSNISLTPVCLAQLCPVERFGTFYAAAYTVSSFGALTGIPVAGALISAAGGEYWGLITFAGVTYAVSLVLFVTVRVLEVGLDPRKKF